MKANILVIDDEESIRFTFKRFLEKENFRVETASNYDEAMVIAEEHDFDLIFSDIILDGRTGIDILRGLRGKKMNCPVIMITGAPNIDTATEALRLNAFDYIQKPVLQKTILQVTKKALEYNKLEVERDKHFSNLETIFTNVDDAYITMDERFSIMEINEAAKHICNLSRYAIGKPFSSCIKNNCSGMCFDALARTIKSKQSVRMDKIECMKKKDVRQEVTVVTNQIKDEDGNISGVIMVVRDETPKYKSDEDTQRDLHFQNIVGQSKKMLEIVSIIKRLADIQTTVLITGESGTGKELVAEAIHKNGIRRNKPLIKVNCSALSDNLLESELFGHAKGSFTGAIKDRMGRFEMADGGTIFLDEIGDISYKTQLQLLRVLQERIFERVGDSEPVKVDVRVIAATNQDLLKKIKSGTFRKDLYYRLKVAELTLPPLRERREDILPLTHHFLEKLAKRLKMRKVGVSPNVEKIFLNYPWPGNIRELEHVIECALVLCNQKNITVEHLPSALINGIHVDAFDQKSVKESEPQLIIQALRQAKLNRRKAAQMLGMSRSTFYRKIEEYNINLNKL